MHTIVGEYNNFCYQRMGKAFPLGDLLKYGYEVWVVLTKYKAFLLFFLRLVLPTDTVPTPPTIPQTI